MRDNYQSHATNRYAYTDVHATLADAARSMVAHGIADGKRHLLPGGYALLAVPLLFAVIVGRYVRRVAIRCAGHAKSA